ncbi:hypothetical protein PBI_SCTP2_498 [Salicola phage SCTP-2]|nr:hypothetical protein PBI_SCTP2_498 [Salicola phage SCTP-2]
MTEAEEKIVHQILKYGCIEVHHKDSLKWKRREKLREMEERDIVEYRPASTGLYLSYGPGNKFYDFLEENNIQTFSPQEHEKEKKRKRMEQYNDPETHGKGLKGRARKMRDKVKVIFKY